MAVSLEDDKCKAESDGPKSELPFRTPKRWRKSEQAVLWPQGFGVRQDSAVFREGADRDAAQISSGMETESGAGSPHSKTLSRFPGFRSRILLLFFLAFCFETFAQTVSNPMFTPVSGTRLPVTVTISDTTPGSTIYFTLDGTVPDTNATLYAVPLTLTNYTSLRARAFQSGLTPSDTVSANYLTWPDPPGISYQRVVTNDLPDQPLVTVTVAGASNVACFTIEERMPALIQPANITGDGMWNATRGALRWDPFTNTPSIKVSYRVTGMAGTYQVDGSASVDGAWTFSPSPSSVTIAVPGGGGGVPMMPSQVATPVFTPASGGNVPVDVAISCATAGAVIYYTLDGTVPTTAATLYTGAVTMATASVVRARAFTNGWTPSVAAVAYYGPTLAPADAQVTRSVSTNPPTAPVVSFNAAPGTNASCWAVEEWLPLGLSTSNVTAQGVFSPSNRVVRWGPFSGSNAVALSYQAIGAAGSYPVRATWSVDGVSGGETLGMSVVVASATGGGGVPTAPSQVPTPVLSPAIGTNLPVTVTISDSDGQAIIRFTLDGTLPTEASALYTNGLVFATPTTLRARGFRAGYTPSVAVVGYYQAANSGASLGLVRAVSGNGTYLPAISIIATPQGSVRCYAVTETVASRLTPYEIGQDAVWNETNRTLKWGPYPDATPRVLTYKLSGSSATYALAGQGSFDGNAVPITGATTVTMDLATMPVVATPVIAPVPNGIFPVDVTISCATTGAVIHFTTDGTEPDESAPVYAGTVRLNTITLVRARAFRAWSVPSGTVTVLYGDEQPASGTSLGRTITGSGKPLPLVQITVHPGAAVKCYVVSEVLPVGLTPLEICGDGVFSAVTRTVRWGPFLDAQERRLSFRLSGPDGSYELSGSGSFDGFSKETTGDRIVVVDTHAYLVHTAVSNSPSGPTVQVTATPPTLAVCYTVEEFLPTGVTPQNISDEGLWNAGTLTIKWGPFLDHVPRMFHYDPIGATNHYLASGRISVDGVSHLWNGEVTVQTWLVFGQVELESYVGPASDGQGTRAVTFKATEDDGTLLATWSLPLQFARGTGLRTVGGYTLRNVPSGTTHLSAKTAWSLRKRLTVMLAGESAEANFTESAALPGVDLNDSNIVDLGDYYTLAGSWGTSSPAADLDGNGRVDLDDYFLLASHWNEIGEPE